MAQQNLPHTFTDTEKLQMPAFLNSRGAFSVNSLVTPPSSPVRTIGEWEELQGLLIVWTSYQSMLKEIVRAAKQECRVYIATNNPSSVIAYLANNGIDTVNVTMLNIPFNSVWCRDYGPWSAYTNDVDSLITIDWIYNRPRPLDDAVPGHLSTQLNSPLYETVAAPDNLIHTGGNFMSDGFGTGFSSNLVVDENPGLTLAAIDTIMKSYMGIHRYIKMPTLPYDDIHHIDMHMKLLDEETLLVGEYPPGIADGPQIEANLQYVLANFNSIYGTPYRVIRIPMPADNGLYPHNGGDYFTYANSSFINKTLIVPTYNVPEDSIALNIYREALPGYTVTGINSLSSISALGALHCITKELGTSDPLLISHQRLQDTYNTINPYPIVAMIKHRSGIQQAMLHWRSDTTLPYNVVPMNPVTGMPGNFSADIPAQPVGTNIYYYVQAQSVSGKIQVRPMPAPAGYWKFKVMPVTDVSENSRAASSMEKVFPNPARSITCIPVYTPMPENATVILYDITGKEVSKIFSGTTKAGNNKYFFDASGLNSGMYFVEYSSEKNKLKQKILIH
jgi:agmatine/peptidylarginine deiminase